MAESNKQSITTSWSALQIGGVDITNGEFTIFSIQNKRVGIIISSILPTAQNGDNFLEVAGKKLSYSLGVAEKIYCKTDTGTTNVGITDDAALPTDFYDYFSAVNQSLVGAQKMVDKFGFSNVISTTKHDVWNAPTNVDIIWQTSASTYDVVSSDTNDTSAGTGARTVLLEGLDANFDELNETVTLNGTTEVTTTGSFIRLNRMTVIDVGAYGGVNAGLLTVGVTGGDPQGYIEADEGQTQKTQFTVPSGKTAYVLNTAISMDTGKVITVELLNRKNADITSAPFGAIVIKHQWDGIDTPIDQRFFANHKFEEKSDLWFKSFVSVGTAIVEVNYDILLIDN